MTVNYYIAVTAAVAAAVPFAAAGWALRRPLPEKTARGIVFAAAAVFALAYWGAGVVKYRADLFGLWDFGIYDSMLHIAAQGGGLLRDFRGGAFDHFSPAALVLLPFYQLWDSPHWLIAFQPVVMAAAAIPLYFAGLRLLRNPVYAMLAPLLYLFNPYFARLALFDFHIECLFPLWFALGFLAWTQHRMRRFLFWMLTLPLIKEDFVIPLGAAGLWMLSLRGRRRAGVLCLAGALLWTLFILKIHFPLLVKADYWHYGRYELFAPTLSGTLANFGAMLARLVQPHVPAVLLSVLLPFAFLPLFSWRGLILLVLPTLGIQLVSAFDQQQLLFSHYASALVGVLPAATILGLRQLRILLWKQELTRYIGAVAGAALGIMLASHILFADLPQNRYYIHLAGYDTARGGSLLAIPFSAERREELRGKLQNAAELKKVTDRIPDGATVVAQNETGLKLLRRCQVFNVPGPEKADFYLFDRENFHRYESPEELNSLLMRLLRDPDYRFERYGKGILLFRKLTPSVRTKR